MSESRDSGRPAQLDDAAWLRERYLTVGDNTIAVELRVSRKSVRLARARLGIVSAPVGRRRGSTATSRLPWREQRRAADRIVDRMRSEQRPGGPAPSLAMIAGRVRALAAADAAGDGLARLDALEALAAVAGLVLDHHLRLWEA